MTEESGQEIRRIEMFKLIWAIIYLPISILKMLFYYLFGITCVRCGKHTRDFSVSRDGLTYCRSCWIKETGRITTI